MNFELYVDYPAPDFYVSFYKRLCEQIEWVFERRGTAPSKALNQFLDNTEVTDQVTMVEFFKQLIRFLPDHGNFPKVVLIIDELTPSHQKPFAVFYIRSATFTLIPQTLNVRIVSVLLGLKTSRSSTTIGQSPHSISKMSFTCQILHLHKFKNSLINIPAK